MLYEEEPHPFEFGNVYGPEVRLAPIIQRYQVARGVLSSREITEEYREISSLGFNICSRTGRIGSLWIYR